MGSELRGINSFIGATKTTYGLIQSFSMSQSADEETAKDASGAVAENDLYNEVQEITMELVPAQGATLPVPSDVIACTVNNVSSSVQIQSINRAESNTGYPTYSVTGKQYVDNTVFSAS